MPSLAELLKNEGVELKPELAEKLGTIIEASDEVRALATTKAELLNWKTDNKAKLDTYESERVANEQKYLDELKQREALAVENNDYKTQLEIIQEREQSLSKTLKARNEEAVNSRYAEEKMKVASMFIDQQKGELLGSTFVKTSLADNGEISTKYNVNGSEYTDFNEFKNAVGGLSYLANDLKGVDSSGGGASPQNSNGNVSPAQGTREDIKNKYGLNS